MHGTARSGAPPRGGSADSLVDVVGVCAASRPWHRIASSRSAIRSGMVVTAHGCPPVPAPAVLELHGVIVPLRSGPDSPSGELTTPTDWLDAVLAMV